MKQCFKCGNTLPLSNFYKHPQMSDGHLNKCKECNKKDVKNNYLEKVKSRDYVEKERRRGRSKYRRLYAGTAKANATSAKKHIDRYPEKRMAILNCSRLKKPFENAERHHWSYNQEHWKDVIWLSKRDHMKAHRFIVYDAERFMYRRCDTMELLNTKEMHESFIMFCIETKED